jgi:hypothetical protein
MGINYAQALPPWLQAARRRFQQWRRTRKAGSRIPQPLWAMAVNLADAYGIHPTAKALGLDYYSLKERVDEMSASRRATPAPGDAARFVELAAPTWATMPECVLELEDVEGTKMRMHIKGLEAAELAALSRSLWGTES